MSISSDQPLLVNQLPISIEFPKEEERFYDVLTLWATRVANAVNSKEGSLYTLQELFDFKQYFTANNSTVFRNDYRKTFDITGLNGGPIAGGATVNFAHNIVGMQQGTLIYATCTTATGVTFTVVYPYFTVDTATGGNI